MRDFFPDKSKAGLLLRDLLKNTDTSDTAPFTLMWNIFDLLVVPNWLCCTSCENKEKSIVLFSCGSPSSNLSLTPTWESKVHHRS